MKTEHLHVTVPGYILKEIENRRKTPNGVISRSAVVTQVLEREFFDKVDKNQDRLPND